MANKALGNCPCQQCGETMNVFQALRKGAHLYSRCTDCGIDQRIGAKVQQYFWDNTTWFEGAPTPPSNVDTESKAKQTVQEGVKQTPPTIGPDLVNTGGVGDFDPLTELPESGPSKGASKQPKGRGGWLVGLGLVAMTMGLAGVVWRV